MMDHLARRQVRIVDPNQRQIHRRSRRRLEISGDDDRRGARVGDLPPVLDQGAEADIVGGRITEAGDAPHDPASLAIERSTHQSSKFAER